MGIRYRPEIDGLRAIAVLAVVLYHAGVGGAGYVGVDLFFVISGYLITSILLAEAQATGGISLLGFYARRVRRILPALVVVVAATLAVGRILLPPPEAVMLERSGAASLLFGANFFFHAHTGGYFDANANEMPLLHLWSLAIEEQFYIAWPLLLLVLVHLRRGRLLLPALVGLSLASFALATYLAMQGPDGAESAFYRTPARFWELSIGGVVAALPMRNAPRALLPFAVALLLAACVFPLHPFPGPGALPAVAGSALLLFAVRGEVAPGLAGAWLRSRPMVGIGLVSYSLYLWHWPLLAMYRATSIGEGDIRVRLGLCLVALLLSVASYRYVEQPFRRLARVGNGRTVAVGATMCASLAAACIALASGTNLQSPKVDDPLAVKAERDFPSKACHETGMQEPRIKCAPGAGTRIGIWGDSLAYAWSPAVRRSDPNAVEFSRDSCPPYIGYLPAKPFPAAMKCERFNALVADQVKGLDTLVLASVWDEDHVALIRHTLDRVAPDVRRVVVLGPTPRMRSEVARCIRQHAENACSITRAEFDAQSAPLLATLRDAAAAHPNVVVVDLTDRFCTATSCPPVLAGVPLYWDKFHISTTVAKSYVLPLGLKPAAVRSSPAG
ncbi:MAG: acyltransferase family protein [Thermomonas sp.]